MATDTLDLFLDWSLKNPPDPDSLSVKDVPFWGDYPTPYDVMSIAGNQVPGLVRVSGKGYEQRLDKKDEAGKPVKFTQLGPGPAEVDIEVLLWTAAHLRQMQNVVKAIMSAIEPPGTPPPGNAKKKLPPPPLAVYHPMLALFGVTQLMFVRLGIPEDHDGDGVYRMRMAAIQHVPDKPQQEVVNPTVVLDLQNLERNGGALTRTLREQRKRADAPSSKETGP